MYSLVVAESDRSPNDQITPFNKFQAIQWHQ